MKKVKLIFFYLFLFLSVAITACHTQKKNTSGANDQKAEGQAGTTTAPKSKWQNQLGTSKSDLQIESIQKLRNNVKHKPDFIIDSLPVVEVKMQNQKNK